MDETKRSDEPTGEPELKQPDEAVKDLEPDDEEGEGVEGGSTYMKVVYTE